MKTVFVTIFILWTLSSFSQIRTLNFHSAAYKFDHKIHTGSIILNTGDTITGSFIYANGEFPWFNLKYYENGEKKGRYMFSKIKEAVLKGSDVALTGKDSTLFIRVSEKDKWLYRQLTFGDIKIYDQLFLINEKKDMVSQKLVVIYQGKKYKTESDQELLSLINKIHPSLYERFKNYSRLEIIRQLNKQS